MGSFHAVARRSAAILRRFGIYRAHQFSGLSELGSKIQQAMAGLHELPIDLDAGAHVVQIGDARNRNRLVIMGSRRKIRTKFVLFPKASGNIVVIGEGSDEPTEARFEGSDNVVLVGDKIPWCPVRIRCVSDNAVVSLGRGSIFNGTEIVVEGDGCGVEIGAEGLFAPNTTIRTSDLHGIYEISSGEWLNRPASVVIEPRVWVGQDATILKGVHIGGGSIVGAGSIVNKDLPGYCSCAGTPAKVIRQGVTWSLARVAEPEEYTENDAKIMRFRR